MRKYWIPKDSLATSHVVIRGDELHHIRDVCRMDVGDKFEVLIGDGRVRLVEVESFGKKEMVARILEITDMPELPSPRIKVMLSIPRFPVLESVLEKMVELGVESVQLVESQFSHVSGQHPSIKNKWDRWDKIITSSCQQSGRGTKMILHLPISLKDALSLAMNTPHALRICAYEGEGGQSLSSQLASVKRCETVKNEIAQNEIARSETGQTTTQQIFVFVGSEGGFSTDEIGQFSQAGILPTTLGQQVLRVETACVALVSIIKYELDQME